MRGLLYAVFITALLGQGAVAQEYPIAGLTPHQRPEGAPVISQPQRSANWEAKLFRGVVKPYPNSLLAQQKNQGAWYTPFDRPGAAPPYDLRGWRDQKQGRK
jgi:hypothetical protein